VDGQRRTDGFQPAAARLPQSRGAAIHRLGHDGTPPRHANGEETSVRHPVKFVLGLVFLPACGGFAVWDGVHRGLLSLVGMGIATLALGLLAIPLAPGVLKWLLTRARR
jgi:hypothetical protein